MSIGPYALRARRKVQRNLFWEKPKKRLKQNFVHRDTDLLFFLIPHTQLKFMGPR